MDMLFSSQNFKSSSSEEYKVAITAYEVTPRRMSYINGSKEGIYIWTTRKSPEKRDFAGLSVCKNCHRSNLRKERTHIRLLPFDQGLCDRSLTF